ncbi:hypothetical protein HXX76_004251 [Chlamydomonas incerta]|uniref:Uncharacterized protein n=1 Tax=Chlamydomonas incerta TaxID=51695 RepID=A0A835T7H2_CHLIN|nr:hypothetical protein HXX76_004251 [Chlamydomonas incerta]|eukprot:KAG2440138.1 hypothetical protein HXX76_004251 [Chlamydomonas incerta]
MASFQDTLAAVSTYHAHNPTVYTGTAGVAFALWHARRSLQRGVQQFHAGGAAAPGAAPPAPLQGSNDVTTLPAELPSALLAAALEHGREALAGLAKKGASLASGPRGASMLDGGAGVHMTAALVLHDAAAAVEAAAAAEAAGAGAGGGDGGGAAAAAAAALRAERDDHVRSFLDSYPEAMDSENDEYLYGRAGYLQGAQLLNAAIGPGTIPDEIIEGVATEILESGREMAERLRWRRTDTPAPPLFYMWPQRERGEPYLGAAHGLMGILFALLHCGPAIVEENRQELRASLAYVASHEKDAPGCGARGGHYPTKMAVSPPDPAEEAGAAKTLVHWCHGAPGAVFLWCKAHEVFGDVGYLAAARRAGEVVWQLGLLRKGHGLCHGTSGNAYALLALHRATGGEEAAVWLHRARQFAGHVSSAEGRSVFDTPDRPLSLFEGRAGALCLLADLLADDGGSRGARFPAFELPPPPPPPA